MQNIKSGKEEIIYLLTKAIEKYKSETGQQIVQNTNRKNYESLAILLSEISNQLPFKSEEWGTESYSPGVNPKTSEYPHRKYDITGGQIKDALIGIVANPRPFLVDACYIYLYGMGRKAFKQNPVDENLLLQNKTEAVLLVKRETVATPKSQKPTRRRTDSIFFIIIAVLAAGLIFTSIQWNASRKRIETISHDMKILPYVASQAEIDSLEGVWLCYTGSPQARVSDPNRYHMVVSNVVDIKYKDGYFLFTRYGASFVHDGYMQFESPWLVSIHSYIRNKEGRIESPRHSLMKLDEENKYKSVISASWSFDVGEKNNIIGIREVYIKQGKGGTIEEVLNTVENASCQCKIVKWHQSNNAVKVFQLKNHLLDNMPEQELKSLLDEKSILLRVPDDSLLIRDTSRHQLF